MNSTMNSIVILGMHRSGTSAITRALNLLGGDLGPREDIGAYWESHVMRTHCDSVLGVFNGAWDCPGIMPSGWETSDGMGELQKGASAAIARYGNPDVLLWKDPRACLTLPFWREHLGDDPIAIIIYRHPEEVWASLDTRNEFGAGLSFALWERYNSDALIAALGLRTVVLSYPELIANQNEVMTQLAATLHGWGVELKDPGSTDMELQANRHHHVAQADFSNPSATASQKSLFSNLESLNGVHGTFNPPEISAPSPLSLEIIAMRSQIRSSRRELWRARADYRRLAGSRRLLLRHLVQPERGSVPLITADDETLSSGSSRL